MYTCRYTYQVYSILHTYGTSDQSLPKRYHPWNWLWIRHSPVHLIYLYSLRNMTPASPQKVYSLKICVITFSFLLQRLETRELYVVRQRAHRSDGLWQCKDARDVRENNHHRWNAAVHCTRSSEGRTLQFLCWLVELWNIALWDACRENPVLLGRPGGVI